MGKEKCRKCYEGKVLNMKYEDDFDRMYDGGQFTAFDAVMQIDKKYNDGTFKCETCDGTGFIEKTE